MFGNYFLKTCSGINGILSKEVQQPEGLRPDSLLVSESGLMYIPSIPAAHWHADLGLTALLMTMYMEKWTVLQFPNKCEHFAYLWKIWVQLFSCYFLHKNDEKKNNNKEPHTTWCKYSEKILCHFFWKINKPLHLLLWELNIQLFLPQKHLFFFFIEKPALNGSHKLFDLHEDRYILE